LGSKLPAGVSQPPQFAKPPWETRPQSQMMQKATASIHYKNEPIVSRPLDHIPHIRNPKLRQYYLQGTAWELNNTVGTKEHVGGPPDGSTGSTGLPGDTVFSVSSQFSSDAEPSAEESKTGDLFSVTSTRPSSDTLIVKEQLVSKRKDTSVSRKSSNPQLDSDSGLNKKKEADQDCLDSLTAQPQSPSPEAEYDKLLVRRENYCMLLHFSEKYTQPKGFKLFKSGTKYFYILRSRSKV
ncbi:hypothetical protein CHARACLAT_029886, partial [Characodon lateralis]|nr:hypothetical protein [Characodon lateralis]